MVERAGRAALANGAPAEAIEVYEQLLGHADLGGSDRAQACDETTIVEVLLGDAVMGWATRAQPIRYRSRQGPMN